MRGALAGLAAWRVLTDPPSAGLFTGYYEPTIRASRTRGGAYQTPIHMRPDDLVEVNLGEFREALKGQRIAGKVVEGKLKPYADRAEIADGALAGRNLEIFWAADPVDVFFMQIQGSGRLQFDDGSTQRVGYAAQNGHVYFAIGKELVRRGALTPDAVSLQTIRAWLQANPGAARDVMNANPSYVFFRPLQTAGPVGSTNVVLTPERSLAVDPKFIPYHTPLWLETTLPNGEPLRRVMVAQDTGGAIVGAVRGDVFFGAGAQAESWAGEMKQPGRYALLLPKGTVPPNSDQ
jgi:membrane-bound lytic murein transglycosylase A